MWADTTWAGAMSAGDNEVIGILGESLIVFCMVFVSVVVVIKLAERSVDVAGLHVLGGHEIGGGAGHARTGNTHAAASRRNGGAPSPRRGPHDERSRDARARPESDGESRKGSAPGLRRRSSTDKKMHTPARESLGGMRHSSCSNSECYTGEKLRRKLSCIEEVSSDAFTDESPHASPLSHKRGTRTEFRHSMTMGEGNMSKRGDAAGGLRPEPERLDHACSAGR